MSNDIAILHDQFRTLGGAERVAVEMARALDAPIYAARVDDDVAPDDVTVRELFDGVAGRAMRQHWLVQDMAQTFAWQRQSALWEYDTILVNKTNPLWYQPRDHQTVLGYLHSTPRSFYDQFDTLGGGLSTVMYTAMRALYEGNRTRPDAWACNSELVARRASLYWDRQRNVSVIYPPVDTDSFSPDDAATGDAYVTLGRLSHNKRVGDIIRAFWNTGRKLIVAGDGSQREQVEGVAAGHRNIEVRGYVTEREKQHLLSRAKAFVMNAESEDFGISPIEAMAAGTPVIGVNEGFTRCQVRDGQNGLLYDRGDLSKTVAEFERHGVSESAAEIAASVAHLNTRRFHAELNDWVAQHRDAGRVESDVTAPVKPAAGGVSRGIE